MSRSNLLVLLSLALVPLARGGPSQEGAASGALRMAATFGDHMVVQRDSTVTLPGWTGPGEAVRVTASWIDEGEAASETRADGAGAFRAVLPTPPAGGPHWIEVASGASRARAEDVLSGELWIASGQSNMEWHMSWTPQGVEATPTADHPRIRLFDVPMQFDSGPRAEIGGGPTGWHVCTPASVAEFSAVAYFFARDLHAGLEGVPIGIVRTAWGGTVIEAWTSEASLRVEGDFDEPLDRLARLRSGVDADDLTRRQQHWWDTLAGTDPGFASGWNGADHDASGWDTARAPLRFSDLGLGAFDGTIWFRRAFKLPDSMQGEDLTLRLGAVDDMDVTWVNGVEVGAVRQYGRWSEDRSYTIPARVLQPGVNQIVVLAVDTGGGGTLGGVQTPPSGIRLVSADGDELDLGGTWSYREGVPLGELHEFPRQGFLNQNTPTALYNAMIAPIAHLNPAGVIWYQGESNFQRAHQYRRLKRRWIQDWRAAFGRADLPMLWVQIAPCSRPGDQGHSAELREAQALALDLPHTGMAVTMDIGDAGDIHPAHKDVVGARLARLARHQVYGQPIACQGPRYREMAREGSRLRLFFDHTQPVFRTLGPGDEPGSERVAGLTADEAALAAFTIAGDDRVFHPATAVVRDGTVIVGSSLVPQPVAVRFAWGAGAVVGLKNADGLPCPSFRTDDWPMVSATR